MKKILIAILAISGVALAWAAPPLDRLPELLVPPSEARITSVIVVGSVPVGTDYTHILFWANGESGTDGQNADYVTSTTNGEYPNGITGSDNSDITIDDNDTISPKVGSLMFYLASAQDYYSFPVTSDNIADDAKGTIAGWTQYNGTVANGVVFALVVRSGGYAYVRFSVTTGDVEVRYNDGATSTTICQCTSANTVEDTWYWIEFSWDDANNTRKLSIYNASLELIDSVTNTDAFSWSDFSYVYIGEPSSTVLEHWIDQVIITNRTTGETGYANTASCPR